VNSSDEEKILLTFETDYFVDVFDVEERYSVFIQADSADRFITRQVFAFKFNDCDMRSGSTMRNNFLLQMLLKGAQTLNIKCPFVNGTKLHSYNQTFDDNLLPPIPVEIKARYLKEVFGKLKDTNRWRKLHTLDVVVRAKK
jgi:hypothetical protein